MSRISSLKERTISASWPAPAVQEAIARGGKCRRENPGYLVGVWEDEGEGCWNIKNTAKKTTGNPTCVKKTAGSWWKKADKKTGNEEGTVSRGTRGEGDWSKSNKKGNHAKTLPAGRPEEKEAGIALGIRRGRSSKIHHAGSWGRSSWPAR